MSSIKIKDPKTGKWEEVPYFQGKPGTDGITPHIGPNGNWFVGDADTGMPSRGADGDPGQDGHTPQRGVDYFTEADRAAMVAAVIESLGGNPVFGYVDENNNIIVSGNLADGTYSVKYEMEDGSTVEVGTLEVGSGTASYTNLADPTSTDWQEGYRLSLSSGGTSALAGHITTNYIPCKRGDVLRVKGLNIVGYLADGATESPNAAKIVTYDSSKTKLAGLYGITTTGNNSAYASKVTTSGDVSTYTILRDNDDVQCTTSECAYVRIDGELMDGYTAEDVVITINEEITD